MGNFATHFGLRVFFNALLLDVESLIHCRGAARSF
jgi:hypothetical protein